MSKARSKTAAWDVFVVDDIEFAKGPHEVGLALSHGNPGESSVGSSQNGSTAIDKNVRGPSPAPWRQAKLRLYTACVDQVRNFTVVFVNRDVVHAAATVAKPVSGHVRVQRQIG